MCSNLSCCYTYVEIVVKKKTLGKVLRLNFVFKSNQPNIQNIQGKTYPPGFFATQQFLTDPYFENKF